MLFYGLKNLCLSTNTAMFVSTQATKDAADVFMPPQPDQVAFGDALLRAADVLLSLCRGQDDPMRRLLQYQKYRDAESFADLSTLEWNTDIGRIKKLKQDY